MGVPVIDFSKLDGQDRAATMAQIHVGCQQWGFFQLVNHGIPEEVLERVKRVSSEWYKLEREEAFNHSKPVTMLNHIINSQQGDSGSKVEGVDWEDVVLLTDDADHWPSTPPAFKETLGEYRAQVKTLAEKIMEIMDENLGLEKGYIKNAFNSDTTAGESEESGGGGAFFGTKVSHYPPCPHPELVTGLRAHTDAGGVILLFQDDLVAGLQMLKGDQWIDVQPLPNAIVINTGDQIEVLSNGRYKSAWHRVVASAQGTRRSIASFYNPSYKATIAPAPHLLPIIQDDDLKATDHDDDDAPPSETTTTGGVQVQQYPKFLFGNYMSVYQEQKFLPKEPRFHAVQAM